MSNARIQLEVAGTSDVQLFVIDHDLHLVASSQLPWQGALPAGIYRLKFRRNTSIHNCDIVLRPGTGPVREAAPPLESRSAAPLNSSHYRHEYHMAAANRQSTTVNRTLGQGGQLFLFVRDWTTEFQKYRTENPAVGLTLLDADGTVLSSVDQEAARGGTANEDRWAALNLELAPGSYRLRLDSISGTQVEQTIVVSNGWQTQVFLLLTNYGTAEAPDWRADLVKATILMARAGQGFSDSSEEFRLTSSALGWLRNRQQSPATATVLRALDGPFINPWQGVYAVHAAIEGGGETFEAFAKQNREPRLLDALRKAIAQLADALPVHPEVLALRLWLGDREALASIMTPPMLATSWSIIVAASASHPDLVVAGSLAARVGSALYGPGPWLVWMPDQFTQAAFISDDELVTIIGQISRSAQARRRPTWVRQLAATQREVFDHLRPPPMAPGRGKAAPGAADAPGPERASPPRPEELVRSLGLPQPTIKDLAAAIAQVRAAAKSRRPLTTGLDS